MTADYTQQTWADIVAYVGAIDPIDDADARGSVYATLGNVALDLISQASGGLYGSMTSGGGAGDISISGRNATYPIQLRDIESAWWDDYELDERDTAWLDRKVPGWRSNVGNPKYFVRTNFGLVLDAEPAGATDGKLVLWGLASLPHFSTAGGALNPLTYLPFDAQMAPAYYIVKSLPLPKRDVTREEVQLLAMMRQENATLWESAFASAVAALHTRRYKPFSM